MRILYGRAVFSSAARRDRVVARWQTAADRGGFVATDALAPQYGPGMAPFTLVAGDEGGELVAGQSYAAISLAFTHADPAEIDRAQLEILDAMKRNGWIHGDFGVYQLGD